MPSLLRPRSHCAEAMLESVLGEHRGQVGLLSSCKAQGWALPRVDMLESVLGERRGQVGLLSTCKARGRGGQALADSRGQGSLVCCSPRGRRVSHDWAAAQQRKLPWATCRPATAVLESLPFFSDESNTSVFLRGSLGNVNFCRAINTCVLHLLRCGFEKFCLGSGVTKNYVQSWRHLFSSLYFSEHLYFLQSVIFRTVLC